MNYIGQCKVQVMLYFTGVKENKFCNANFEKQTSYRTLSYVHLQVHDKLYCTNNLRKIWNLKNCEKNCWFSNPQKLKQISLEFSILILICCYVNSEFMSCNLNDRKFLTIFVLQLLLFDRHHRNQVDIRNYII